MRITQAGPQAFLFDVPDPGQRPLSAVSDQTADQRAPPSQIRVFVISDVRLHRDGLTSLLRGCPAIQVLGGDSLSGALVALPTLMTDVALLDALQPADSCLALRDIQPQLRILALGIRGIASEVLSCAAARIDGYTPIDATVEEMLATIEAVAHGEPISREATASRYDRTGAMRPPPTTALTARELQVADLLNRGLPTKQIARSLGVQPCTAKNHVRNILQKLDVHCRGQAAAKLRRLMGELLGR